MSNEAKKARDEQLIASIAVVLTSGFAIESSQGDARIERIGELCDVLTLQRHDALRPIREHFDDLHEAIRYYLDHCEGS